MASNLIKAPDDIYHMTVTKIITRAANANYSQEKIPYNIPSGYTIIGVTTTIISAEFLQPVLTSFSGGELKYMIKNGLSEAITRTLYADLIFMRNG